MVNEKKNYIFYYDLFTIFSMIVGVLLSRFMINFALALLLTRFLFIGSWKQKKANLLKQKDLLLCLLSFFFLHILGLIWTDNFSFALNDINKKIAFLIVPLSLSVIAYKDKNILKPTFLLFCLVLFVGTVWGLITYLSEPYPDLRLLIPSANHIRFSLCLCFAILVLIYLITNYWQRLSFKIKTYNLQAKYPALFLLLWFVFYLFLTQAITGIAILFAFLFCYIIYNLIVRRKNILLFSLLTLSCVGFFLLGYWVVKEYKSYFTPNPIYSQKLLSHTPDNGIYYHNHERGLIENGNYTHLYVCPSELEEAWKKRTGLEVDNYMDALIRYMNSISPYKDARRFSELTDNDIDNIKNHIANKDYTHNFSLKPRLYKFFFQYDSYRATGSVKGFSEFQRFELWANSIATIKDNPLFGVGTGDIVDKFNEKLEQRNSSLKDSGLKPHNQYLFIIVSFGLIGFLIFLFWLIYPIIKTKLYKNYIYMAFFFVVMVSMLAEDTLDNVMGISFYIFFSSLMLFNAEGLKKTEK